MLMPRDNATEALRLVLRFKICFRMMPQFSAAR
jgi:hypothetical protein